VRGKVSQIAGARLIFQPVQDIRVGGRQSNALYQYTLQDDSLPELNIWAPKIADQLATLPELTDVNSDQQDRGLETDLVIDRATAARLSLTVDQIDNTLYDAFGQRQVSVIYAQRNQSPRDGGRSRVLAEPRHAEADLCQHRWRDAERYANYPGGRRNRDGGYDCQQCRQRHQQQRGDCNHK
jgi:hypothetical protein